MDTYGPPEDQLNEQLGERAERKAVALAWLREARIDAEYGDDEDTMGAIDRVLMVFGSWTPEADR